MVRSTTFFRHPLRAGTLLLAIALLCPAARLAGQVKKGFQALEAQQYEAAAAYFKADLEDEKYGPAAQLGLGLLYLDSSTPFYDLQAAEAALQEARTAYRAASDRVQKKLDRKDWGRSAIGRANHALAREAYRLAAERDDTTSYRAYLEAFPRTNRRGKQAAERRYAELLWEHALREDSYAGYDALFQQHGAFIAAELPQAFQELEDRLFFSFVEENGWPALSKFKQRYPQSVYLKDKGLAAFQVLTEQSPLTEYQRFLRRYPRSAFAPAVRDRLESLRESQLAVDQEMRFLAGRLLAGTSPDSVQWIDRCLAGYLSTQNKADSIERWIAGADGSNLPQVLDTLYQRFYQPRPLPALERFLERYPQYYNRRLVEEEIQRRRQPAESQVISGHSEVEQQQLHETILEKAPAYEAFMALQKLVAPPVRRQDWSAVRRIVTSYRSHFESDTAALASLLELVAAPEQGLRRLSLGNKFINTSFSEYIPVMSADGRQLYFCRNNSLLWTDENVFVAERVDTGWSKPLPVPAYAEVGVNFAPSGISADGTRLILFRNGELGEGQLEEEGWTPFQPYDNNINATVWTGLGSFAPDGQVLIFSAKDRDDMIGLADDGNIDLYVAFRQPDGGWSRARNLGAVINTPYRDRSPFLHPDNRTLYFSSEGHGGMGDLDVFKTTRLDDTWTNWSKPVNLGKEINTAGSDWGYRISTDGALAYFSASGEGEGQQNLYQIQLPAEVRPGVVSALRGRVQDPDGQPLQAEVVVDDLSTGKPLGTFRSNPYDGRFYVVLPHAGQYGFTARRDNYFPASGNVGLDASRLGSDVEQTITLTPLAQRHPEAISFVLRNLFFAVDSYELESAVYPELERLVELLKANDFTIEIGGHTDDTGSATYNRKLSRQRAEAVKSYLVARGIAPDRIQTVGYGASNPVESNRTEAGRTQNRRVEVRILQ